MCGNRCILSDTEGLAEAPAFEVTVRHAFRQLGACECGCTGAFPAIGQLEVARGEAEATKRRERRRSTAATRAHSTATAIAPPTVLQKTLVGPDSAGRQGPLVDLRGDDVESWPSAISLMFLNARTRLVVSSGSLLLRESAGKFC